MMSDSGAQAASNSRLQSIACLMGMVAPGLLHATLFPPLNLGALAFLFLVPGLWVAALGAPARRFLWVQFLSSLAGWCFLLIWLRNAHPAAVVGVPALGAVMAGLWTLWWWSALRLAPLVAMGGFSLRVLSILALAGSWICVEWARSWLLTGFPWLPLAASQWQRPVFLQPAEWVGAWGISGMLVVLNAALFSWTWRLVRHAREGWRRLCPEFYLACLAVVGCGILGIRELAARKEIPLGRVALVQPDVPQNEKWDPEEHKNILATLESLHRVAGATRPDLVVWPEAVLPYALKSDPYLASWTQSAAELSASPVLLGTIDIVAGATEELSIWRNAAALVLPGDEPDPPLYLKRKLVPFGEYVPLRSLMPGLAKLVPIGGDFERGSEAVTFSVTGPGGRTFRLGPLICYEDLFPGLAARSTAAGADALVVLTNSAWFGREAFAHQHLAHSVLRAVETRRTVIRCGNSGWSGWIDSWGRTRDWLRDHTTGSVYFRGTATLEITADERWLGTTTFYVRYGKWIPAAAALAWIGGLLIARRRFRTKS